MLIDYHVDALQAELRENADRSKEETARALIARLREVTNDFLSRERA
jgi:hypothetical protein